MKTINLFIILFTTTLYHAGEIHFQSNHKANVYVVKSSGELEKIGLTPLKYEFKSIMGDDRVFHFFFQNDQLEPLHLMLNAKELKEKSEIKIKMKKIPDYYKKFEQDEVLKRLRSLYDSMTSIQVKISKGKVNSARDELVLLRVKYPNEPIIGLLEANISMMEGKWQDSLEIIEKTLKAPEVKNLKNIQSSLKELKTTITNLQKRGQR